MLKAAEKLLLNTQAEMNACPEEKLQHRLSDAVSGVTSLGVPVDTQCSEPALLSPSQELWAVEGS